MSHYTLFKKDKNISTLLLRDFCLGSYFASAFDNVNSSVTDADMDAFSWIKAHVEKTAIFLTNVGDGGALIDSIAERKISNPHGMELWHSEEIKKWQWKNPPTHIYIGQPKNSKYPVLYRKEDLEKRNEKYKLIYDAKGCSVFTILCPALPMK